MDSSLFCSKYCGHPRQFPSFWWPAIFLTRRPWAFDGFSAYLQKCIFTAVTCLPALAAAVPTYTAIDLGSLGGAHSFGYAINAGGQVTGYADTSGNAVHAFLYTGGVMTDLGTLGGDGASFGLGINTSGQVTGYSDVDGVALHACLLYTSRCV